MDLLNCVLNFTNMSKKKVVPSENTDSTIPPNARVLSDNEKITNVLDLLFNSNIKSETKNSMEDSTVMIKMAVWLLEETEFEQIENVINKMQESGALQEKYKEFKESEVNKTTIAKQKDKQKDKKKQKYNTKFASCVDRFKSFENSDVDNDHANLAKAGFYLKDNGNIVCFFCNVELLNDWKESDIPIEEHFNANPECEFVKSVYIPSRNKYNEKNEYKIKIKNINKHLSNFFRELANTIDSESESIPIEEDFDNFDDFQDYTDSYPQNYPNLFQSLHPPSRSLSHLPRQSAFGHAHCSGEFIRASPRIKNKYDKPKKKSSGSGSKTTLRN